MPEEKPLHSLDGHGNLLRRKDPLKEPSFGSWEGMYLW